MSLYQNLIRTYRIAGVREYWVVNLIMNTVNVYDLEKEEMSDLYSLTMIFRYVFMKI